MKEVTCYVSVSSSLLTVIMMMLMIVILMTQMITVMMITMLLLIMIVMENVNNDDMTTMLMIYDDVSSIIWLLQQEFSISLVHPSDVMYFTDCHFTFLDSRPVKKAEKREAQRVGAYMKIVAPSLTDLVSYRKLWHWNAFSPIKKI